MTSALKPLCLLIFQETDGSKKVGGEEVQQDMKGEGHGEDAKDKGNGGGGTVEK